ncbi:MAG: DUF4892 domain-containing protein [Cellvibrionales bacterium]|nr:DUF4892 domain-containing protein [Cellvibrionales bacterium]
MSAILSRAFCRLWLVVFIQSLFFSASSFSSSVKPSLQQLPLIDGAQLIESDQSDVENWELPLSKYQKIDGQWRLSRSEFLSGTLHYHLYQIHPVSRLKEVIKFYQVVFKQPGWHVRFHCERRACGESNDWANRFFKNKRLNGLKGRQSLSVASKNKGTVVLYIVERPTGQLYLAVYELIK